jgi:hypothetical protein
LYRKKMARSISEIKQAIGDSFVGSEAVAQKYGLQGGGTFDEQFSPTSIESLLFYEVAAAISTLERLFDEHRAEVGAELLAKLPHTARWYREKVLRFQHPNRALMAGTDRYDNTGLTPADVAAREVVKYCAVGEVDGTLLVKVAKGEAGARAPLAAEEMTALEAYLDVIRDAGVSITLVNAPADALTLAVGIYYNPLLLSPASKPVEEVIKKYVGTLEFNGALSATRLMDVIQGVPGVELVNITAATVWGNTPLGVQKIANSGYWAFKDENDLQVGYTAYSNEANL